MRFSEAFTRALAWLAGADDACQGHGVEHTVEHTLPSLAWLPAAAWLAASAAVIAIYLRERSSASLSARLGLAGLRVALLGAATLMLYGWMLRSWCTDLPDLILAVDVSTSMLEDGLSAPASKRVSRDNPTESRFEQARSLLLRKDGAVLKSLDERYNLKLYRVAGTAAQETGGLADLQEKLKAYKIDPADAEHAQSRLGDGLRRILEAQRGGPTAAVVMFTDGATTEGKPLSEAADYARRRGVPLFLVGLGSDRPPRDVRLADLLADEMAFVGDLIGFDLSISASGLEGRQVEVRLTRAGDSQILERQTVTLGPDGAAQPLRLSHRAEREGEFEYIVEAVPVEGEARLDNNRLSALVSVRDATIKVLLVQAYPNYEYRYLKSLLGRSVTQGEASDAGKSVELTTVLQQADPELAELDANARRSFPVSREELFEYDVVIFGDVDPGFLTRSVMENLAAFVEERGGGLVVMAGPQFTPLAYRDTPLAPLFPVNLTSSRVPDGSASLTEGFRPQPTRLGLASPALQLADTPQESLRIWQRLEPLYWLFESGELSSGARVLLEHPTKSTPDGRRLPVVSEHFVGAGKVIFHATDETYRWRIGVGDAYFARYWVQTIRYLSRSALLGKSREAELTADRQEYRLGEPVRLRTRFFDDRAAPSEDDGVRVTLEREGGQRREATLRRTVGRGIFEATLSDLADGRYRAWVSAPAVEGKPPSTRFTITAPQGELTRLEMDANDLKLAAQRSGGKLYTADAAEKLLDDLPRGRQVRVRPLPPVPIWNSWKLALVFVSLLISEWLLRKRVGLL